MCNRDLFKNQTAFLVFFLLPHQIKNPVTGSEAQIKLTIKAIIFVGKPKMDPTWMS